MALGLTNNKNNNNKNLTKQNKKRNKNFATMLYKFLSLGWSELSDYNLHILDKKNSLFNSRVVKDDPGQA